MNATPYPICVCVKCGPPWRDVILKPPEDAPMLEQLSWSSWMALCPTCGDKRCPGAIDHDNACQSQPLTLAGEVAAGLHDSPHP